MKVLHTARQVAQRDIVQQPGGRGINPEARNHVARKWRARPARIRRRVIDHRRRSRQRPGKNQAMRKVAQPLGLRGYRGKAVERTLAALHIVIDEEAGLVRTVIDLGNNERTSDRGTYLFRVIGYA